MEAAGPGIPIYLVGGGIRNDFDLVVRGDVESWFVASIRNVPGVESALEIAEGNEQ